jgi:ribosomal protein S12 methylthiotransferase accessory factor YcaO
VEHDDVAVDIRQIISALRSRGIQSAIVIDLTEPGGFPVVRVTIPGLEFWVMDNGKLGQRAVRFWKQHTAIA